METKLSYVTDRTLADRAIDGLFGGLSAGVAMAVVMALGGMLVGESPASVFERFSTGQSATPVAGFMIHLAVSSVYGVVFSLLATAIPRRTRKWVPAWFAGLAYATVLFFLALNVILPGLRSPLAELTLWVLGLGHAVYGILLGHLAYPKSGVPAGKQV